MQVKVPLSPLEPFSADDRATTFPARSKNYNSVGQGPAMPPWKWRCQIKKPAKTASWIQADLFMNVIFLQRKILAEFPVKII